jgi:hypothetical protein
MVTEIGLQALLRFIETVRRRVLAEHTCEKRMGTLVEEMRRRFS